MDIRVLKTDNNIKKTFLLLLKTHTVSEISIKMICNTALISKSTFYKHYEDKYALLSELVNKELQPIKIIITQRFSLDQSTSRELAMAEDIFKYVSTGESNIMSLLNIHEVRGGDLEKELKRLFFESAYNQFKQSGNVETSKAELLAEYYSANAMVSMKWLLTKKSRSDLLNVIKDTQNFYTKFLFE